MVELSTSRLTTGASTTGLHGGSVASTFLAGVDPPGSRHDNDHIDIGDIEIFPTFGEVMSAREEFLPSTDFRQPHFLGDAHLRYLDTYFRLLRHDIFGQLVDFLHQIMLSYDVKSGCQKGTCVHTCTAPQPYLTSPWTHAEDSSAGREHR